MHFSTDRDMGYFSQLTAERLIMKEAAGQRYSVWDLPPGKANEALDCRVYSYAALAGLFHLGLKLNTRAMLIESEPEKVLHPAPPEQEEKTSLRLPGAIIQESEPTITKSIARRLA